MLGGEHGIENVGEKLWEAEESKGKESKWKIIKLGIGK